MLYIRVELEPEPQRGMAPAPAKFRKLFICFLQKKLTKNSENFRFCENFSFGMQIRIQELTECVSSTKTLVDGA
jgi:hypothetical protein